MENLTRPKGIKRNFLCYMMYSSVTYKFPENTGLHLTNNSRHYSEEGSGSFLELFLNA